MKNIFRKLMFLLPTLLLLCVGCDKESLFDIDSETSTGKVSFRKMLVEVKNEESIMRSAAVDVNTFVVTVTDSRTSETEWTGTYAEMPEVLTLPVGNYEVTVNSASNPDADWDTPYFEGSQTFAITEGDITTVDPVVCKLANVKVTVVFSDKLKAVMGSDCKVTVVACDKGRLEFTASETRSGYFRYIAQEGSQPTMVATFSGTVDENYEENFRTYTEVKPGNHYIITYTLKGVEPDTPTQTGKVTPGVNVDSTITVVDLTISVDSDEDIIDDDSRPNEGDDNPVTPPTPGGEAPSLTTNDAISFDKQNLIVSGLEAVIYAHSSAEGGFTEFTVDIDSDTLTPDELESVGLTSHLDLVNPGQYGDALAKLGFPVNVGGLTDPDPMTLTNFLPMLTALGEGTHNFIFKVSDANGTTNKTLTFLTK